MSQPQDQDVVSSSQDTSSPTLETDIAEAQNDSIQAHRSRKVMQMPGQAEKPAKEQLSDGGGTPGEKKKEEEGTTAPEAPAFNPASDPTEGLSDDLSGYVPSAPKDAGIALIIDESAGEGLKDAAPPSPAPGIAGDRVMGNPNLSMASIMKPGAAAAAGGVAAASSQAAAADHDHMVRPDRFILIIVVASVGILLILLGYLYQVFGPAMRRRVERMKNKKIGTSSLGVDNPHLSPEYYMKQAEPSDSPGKILRSTEGKVLSASLIFVLLPLVISLVNVKFGLGRDQHTLTTKQDSGLHRFDVQNPQFYPPVIAPTFGLLMYLNRPFATVGMTLARLIHVRALYKMFPVPARLRYFLAITGWIVVLAGSGNVLSEFLVCWPAKTYAAVWADVSSTMPVSIVRAGKYLAALSSRKIPPVAAAVAPGADLDPFGIEEWSSDFDGVNTSLGQGATPVKMFRRLLRREALATGAHELTVAEATPKCINVVVRSLVVIGLETFIGILIYLVPPILLWHQAEKPRSLVITVGLFGLGAMACTALATWTESVVVVASANKSLDAVEPEFWRALAQTLTFIVALLYCTDHMSSRMVPLRENSLGGSGVGQYAPWQRPIGNFSKASFGLVSTSEGVKLSLPPDGQAPMPRLSSDTPHPTGLAPMLPVNTAEQMPTPSEPPARPERPARPRTPVRARNSGRYSRYDQHGPSAIRVASTYSWMPKATSDEDDSWDTPDGGRGRADDDRGRPDSMLTGEIPVGVSWDMDIPAQIPEERSVSRSRPEDAGDGYGYGRESQNFEEYTMYSSSPVRSQEVERADSVVEEGEREEEGQPPDPADGYPLFRESTYESFVGDSHLSVASASFFPSLSTQLENDLDEADRMEREREEASRRLGSPIIPKDGEEAVPGPDEKSKRKEDGGGLLPSLPATRYEEVVKPLAPISPISPLSAVGRKKRASTHPNRFSGAVWGPAGGGGRNSVLDDLQERIREQLSEQAGSGGGGEPKPGQPADGGVGAAAAALQGLDPVRPMSMTRRAGERMARFRLGGS